jgi:hypothetical protein
LKLIPFLGAVSPCFRDNFGLNLKTINERTLTCLVMSLGNEGKGTIFRRKDNRYLLYLPVRVVYDSMFPLKCNGSIPVKVSFSPNDGKLIMEKWEEQKS